MSQAGLRRFRSLAFLLAFGGSAFAQSPPTELKLVGDHWTAWDPPAAVEEGTEVYTIEQGDTLWDLAERFYGNAYLWPQLWERNRYILDAHWIYPGDPLALGIDVESAEALAAARQGLPTTPEERAAAERARAAAEARSLLFGRAGRENPFVQLGTADDIYCSGFVGELREEFPFEIIGSEFDLQSASLNIKGRGKTKALYGNIDTSRYNLTLGDIVYVDGGRRAGQAPGDVFTAVRPESRVRHPLTGRLLGRLYAYTGRVRILSVQEETSIAEISQVCEAVTLGSRLKPFVPEPIPSERRTPMRPLNHPVSADELKEAPVIVKSKADAIALGEDHVVFVAVGERDDVVPGDIFTLYRQGRGLSPPLVLGEAAILSVHQEASVAKIIASRYPIYVGDFLVPK